MPSTLLTTPEAAKRLGTSAGNLAVMRNRGKGPAFYKRGGRVFYDLRDLDVWKQRLVRHER